MILNDIRRFSTSAYPEELRQSAWSEVLARLLLANEPAPRGQAALSGHVSACSSAFDSVFAQLASSPQVLLPLADGAHDHARSKHAGTVLVLALQAGHGTLTDTQQADASPVSIHAGDIMLLDPAQAWRIELHTDFRAMLVKLESASFVLRLVRTGAQELNRISTRVGVGAVCLSLIQSVADELAYIGRDELPPIEATLIELLVTCLSHKSQDAQEQAEPEDTNPDTTSVQLAHLRRVCRTLESRLGDAELQIDEIARLEGLSTRYIQKLFKAGATSFTEYLKSRRLERCRLDLGNPALAHFSISELCYRWGFSDAANFSRAFSARFGQSPKAYRAAPPKDIEEQLRRGRPAQTSSTTATPVDRSAPAPDDTRRQFQNLLSDHARYAIALALSPKRAAPPSHATQHPATEEHQPPPGHYYLPVSAKTVHWGYFSRSIKPVLAVHSGDIVTIETLTQHATDDCERMIAGDPGAESVFHWTADKKAVDRRGAGPMDASIYGRGAGEGFGVHICTGPVYVQGAEPGDVLEVRILDIQPRPSRHPEHEGRLYGSNAAAWWGFQYNDLLTEPKKREVITVYEIHHGHDHPHAKAVYNYRWTPQTDPFGIRHDTIDYPGVPVDHTTIAKQFGVLEKAVVPVRPHFGVLAVAPREKGMVDSIPPSYFGGNLDNWRATKGARLFLPVAVDGALFSVGDPHASQGDAEACGTAIECSLTGVFQLVLHKKAALADSFLSELDYPFLDTPDEWVLQGLSYPDYLAELGPHAQTQVYKKSSLEAAMRDAFHKARHFLMKAHQLSEDEAISLISVAVDFGITQVVDGNLGVHAVIRKAVFPEHSGELTPGAG
ncbi:MAG: acetamidase/formamidase family protein [Moraxellaceae bacterium]|nr:acetamidase/formamidase family protein [Moraxellaceae bacterium]